MTMMAYDYDGDYDGSYDYDGGYYDGSITIIMVTTTATIMMAQIKT